LSGQYRVIRYDLLGHGDAMPLSAPVSSADFNAQANAVLDSCGIDRAVLIGFSLGGIIARTVAASRPDRVAGIVLLNTISIRPPDIQRQVRERADRIDAGDTDGISEQAIERWFTPEFRQSHPAVIDAVLDRLGRNTASSYRHAYRFFADSDAEAAASHGSINTPTLVITGEDDRNSTPAMAYEIAAEISGATAHILPGMRHMGLVEDPDALIDLIVPFLNDIAA
jgi:pimeloyl-ACP methyl ester carboxylesterase